MARKFKSISARKPMKRNPERAKARLLMRAKIVDMASKAKATMEQVRRMRLQLRSL